ncbi:hypothetical protein F1559_000415 [Cyanidiococcus yangmingshanensis]|uniref:Cupin type-1 domain-containing protein n=1 Tax=Cyanidiococcus yangmingshanensis TaxID=2690220 RepID=A0A7J7IBD8_9RHOD|nr:hypothetical protein F1559_000415 [Cyanidiococcus yangmingshanensis]
MIGSLIQHTTLRGRLMWRRLLVPLFALLLVTTWGGKATLAADAPAAAPLLQWPGSAFVLDLGHELVTVTNTSLGSIQAVNGATNGVLHDVELSTLVFTIEKCAILAPHVHTNLVEYVYVTGGSGTFSLWSSNGSVVLLRQPITSGYLLVIPPGWPHMFTGPETESPSLVLTATVTSSAPQVYFLAGAGSIWTRVPGDAMGTAFNVTATAYTSFFDAQHTGGLLQNATCASQS